MALFHVKFFSETLGMCMEVNAIIPQANTPGVQATPPFQTLYLLHGMSDDHTNWQRNTSIERYVQPLGLAVIMPAVHLSWYTDMYHGGKYFTYVTEELPRVMETFFPLSTAREDRFAAGLSMGGYGAMKLGLRCPDRYAAVASLSGGLNTVAILQTPPPQPSASKVFENIWGSLERLQGSDDDLFALAERLSEHKQDAPKLFQWCGTEDFLYQHNLQFRDHVQKLGLDLDYSESEGDHSWKYWDQHIQRVLNWLPLRKYAEVK